SLGGGSGRKSQGAERDPGRRIGPWPVWAREHRRAESAGLSRGGSGRERLANADLRGAALSGRQLALAGRPLLSALRQAAAPAQYGDRGAVSFAAAPDVSARERRAHRPERAGVPGAAR